MDHLQPPFLGTVTQADMFVVGSGQGFFLDLVNKHPFARALESPPTNRSSTKSKKNKTSISDANHS
jgi:hypothetical protein